MSIFGFLKTFLHTHKKILIWAFTLVIFIVCISLTRTFLKNKDLPADKPFLILWLTDVKNFVDKNSPKVLKNLYAHTYQMGLSVVTWFRPSTEVSEAVKNERDLLLTEENWRFVETRMPEKDTLLYQQEQNIRKLKDYLQKRDEALDLISYAYDKEVYDSSTPVEALNARANRMYYEYYYRPILGGLTYINGKLIDINDEASRLEFIKLNYGVPQGSKTNKGTYTQQYREIRRDIRKLVNSDPSLKPHNDKFSDREYPVITPKPAIALGLAEIAQNLFSLASKVIVVVGFVIFIFAEVVADNGHLFTHFWDHVINANLNKQSCWALAINAEKQYYSYAIGLNYNLPKPPSLIGRIISHILPSATDQVYNNNKTVLNAILTDPVFLGLSPLLTNTELIRINLAQTIYESLANHYLYLMSQVKSRVIGAAVSPDQEKINEQIKALGPIIHALSEDVDPTAASFSDRILHYVSLTQLGFVPSAYKNSSYDQIIFFKVPELSLSANKVDTYVTEKKEIFCLVASIVLFFVAEVLSNGNIITTRPPKKINKIYLQQLYLDLYDEIKTQHLADADDTIKQKYKAHIKKKVIKKVSQRLEATDLFFYYPLGMLFSVGFYLLVAGDFNTCYIPKNEYDSEVFKNWHRTVRAQFMDLTVTDHVDTGTLKDRNLRSNFILDYSQTDRNNLEVGAILIRPSILKANVKVDYLAAIIFFLSSWLFCFYLYNVVNPFLSWIVTIVYQNMIIQAQVTAADMGIFIKNYDAEYLEYKTDSEVLRYLAKKQHYLEQNLARSQGVLYNALSTTIPPQKPSLIRRAGSYLWSLARPAPPGAPPPPAPASRKYTSSEFKDLYLTEFFSLTGNTSYYAQLADLWGLPSKAEAREMYHQICFSDVVKTKWVKKTKESIGIGLIASVAGFIFLSAWAIGRPIILDQTFLVNVFYEYFYHTVNPASSEVEKFSFGANNSLDDLTGIYAYVKAVILGYLGSLITWAAYFIPIHVPYILLVKYMFITTAATGLFVVTAHYNKIIGGLAVYLMWALGDANILFDIDTLRQALTTQALVRFYYYSVQVCYYGTLAWYLAHFVVLIADALLLAYSVILLKKLAKAGVPPMIKNWRILNLPDFLLQGVVIFIFFYSLYEGTLPLMKDLQAYDALSHMYNKIAQSLSNNYKVFSESDLETLNSSEVYTPQGLDKVKEIAKKAPSALMSDWDAIKVLKKSISERFTFYTESILNLPSHLVAKDNDPEILSIADGGSNYGRYKEYLDILAQQYRIAQYFK